MRGKLQTVNYLLFPIRITPAHAGKTTRVSRHTLCSPDHPRACGENVCALSARKALDGSPPRMRGKPGIVKDLNIFDRITPAHAGKTVSVHVTPPRRPGSPPRMRGKRDSTTSRRSFHRITPAHAGKTTSS